MKKNNNCMKVRLTNFVNAHGWSEVDLHLHSRYSDGASWPEGVVQKAVKRGKRFISVTDHDCILGNTESAKWAQRNGCEYIAGVEFSTDFAFEYKGEEKTLELHILGYDIDTSNTNLSELCSRLAEERKTRNRTFYRIMKERFNIGKARILRANGFPITYKGYIGKPHFAVALMDVGVVTSVDEAFRDIFSDSSFTCVKKNKPKSEHVIKTIMEAGGMAVLAHPGRIKLLNELYIIERRAIFENMLYQLKNAGLEGMECLYSRHTYEQEKYFRSKAEEFGLLVTKGSDCHD